MVVVSSCRAVSYTHLDVYKRQAQIVTFGTMAARGVIRDVGRVMDLPYAMVDSIAKMIPTEIGITTVSYTHLDVYKRQLSFQKKAAEHLESKKEIHWRFSQTAKEK